MKKLFFAAIALINIVFVFAQSTQAPAYPLITHDPYFSIWSTTYGGASGCPACGNEGH